jgi:hypothetical protein
MNITFSETEMRLFKKIRRIFMNLAKTTYGLLALFIIFVCGVLFLIMYPIIILLTIIGIVTYGAFRIAQSENILKGVCYDQ